MTKTKNEKGVWYLQFVRECVYCGRQDVHRERQPAPPPKDRQERYTFKQDVCGTHFT